MWPEEERGAMVAIKIGWYSPVRAGGWRPWLLDLRKDFIVPAPTGYVELCALGFSVELTVGWPGKSSVSEGEAT